MKQSKRINEYMKKENKKDLDKVEKGLKKQTKNKPKTKSYADMDVKYATDNVSSMKVKGTQKGSSKTKGGW